ncbi:MAG: alkaline phosphatase family protein [Neptuniibacter sp.]
MTSTDSLPFIIAGPILRRVLPDQMVIWLVTSAPLYAELSIYEGQENLIQADCADYLETVQVGTHAYVNLINFRPGQNLPVDTWLNYELSCNVDGQKQNLQQLLPHLIYSGEERPGFVIKTQIDQILHGSCRKPHHAGPDALLQVDKVLADSCNKAQSRPALLMMTGDQIYADDVAGPMLSAIHQVVKLLGLTSEQLEGATVCDCETLYQHSHCYYQRENLLPQTEDNSELRDRFFAGARKPIFTADTAHNHLITFAEVMAMYLLVWSPQLWSFIHLGIQDVDDEHADLYLEEQKQIESFAKGLDKVQSSLAHIPVYMIFDDHDVTDDWNLTRGWEEAAYSHPFSRRIIGNALMGYWLCQGWGNAPERFPVEWQKRLKAFYPEFDLQEHDEMITALLEFEHWHYSLPTQPKMVVLDTRTQRWWSESSGAKPSGLMDWEVLSDLQTELMGEPAVIMVSPAPIFGMKLIETVQRVFTFFGHALTVDAENWMAHKGSANVILNIFRHRKTPQNFVILSGDVHFSFAYDVKLRFRKNSPDIWQITCSGFKNEFPEKLLSLFDRLNRWLYGVKSPLNFLTKRRSMKIIPRIPAGFEEQRSLNNSGVGRVLLDENGKPEKVSVLTAQGQEIEFPERTDL